MYKGQLLPLSLLVLLILTCLSGLALWLKQCLMSTAWSWMKRRLFSVLITRQCLISVTGTGLRLSSVNLDTATSGMVVSVVVHKICVDAVD